MDQELTYLYVNELNAEDSENPEKLKELIAVLQGIIKRQNGVILELRNSCIRLENNFKLSEAKIEYYNTYKSLCELILDKTRKNPISALWFLHSVRKKIEEFYEQN